MSQFRRRLMMMALANNNVSSIRTDLVTWEDLYKVFPKWTFIREYNGSYKIYKDYDKDRLTWEDLYKIVPPGIYFEISSDGVVSYHNEDNYGYPHKKAYVRMSDFRKIFPVGLTFEMDNDEITIVYDPSVTNTNEDPNKILSYMDLYKIVPKGIIFYKRDGDLLIRQVEQTIQPVSSNLPDITECSNTPVFYNSLMDTHYVRMCDFYQILPSGLKLELDASANPIITYTQSLDYMKSDVVTFGELQSVISYFGNKKLVVNRDGKVELSTHTTLYTSSTPVTWGIVREVIPKGVTMVRMNNDTYKFVYNSNDVSDLEIAGEEVTWMDLSRIIPFGVNCNNGFFTKVNQYPIYLSYYNQPITKDFLAYFTNGLKVQVNDATGELSLVK